MKKLLTNLVLATLTVTLLLFLVEKVLDWADYDYRPLTIEARDDLRDTLALREDHFELDPQLLWRPRRSYKIFNAQGFRGPLVSDSRAPGEVRIFTVGDSNTLGWRGEDGANWPASVGRLASPGVQVFNAGVWGYTSFQGVLRLEEILPYAPDIVTISFGSNDAHPVRLADRESARGGAGASWLKTQAGRSRLGRLLIGSLDRLRNLAARNAMTRRVPLEEYRDNLRRMVARTRESGAVPVLMTRPYIKVPNSQSEWRTAAPDYNAATFEIARELDTPLIDFYTHFKQREELFADDSHFTAEGIHLAARLAWEELRPLVEATAPDLAKHSTR